MYRSSYTSKLLFSFDDDDATGGPCFSRDFHDTGYGGYVYQEEDACQAFEIESYGTLTMSTGDHLRNAKRARLSTALRNPISSVSRLSRPTKSTVSRTSQTGTGVNAARVATTQSLTRHHESHARDEAFKSAGEADKVRLAAECPLLSSGFRL